MYFQVGETQSELGTSWTGYPVGLGTQSGLGTSRTGYPVGTGYPVRLGDRSDWYPVTQSGTGTGASLARAHIHRDVINCLREEDIYIMAHSVYLLDRCIL